MTKPKIKSRPAGRLLSEYPDLVREWHKTNSLATTNPKIAQQWHKIKNAPLTAKDVEAGSDKNVWWQCKRDKDHVWQDLISNRTTSRSPCPHCLNKEIDKKSLLALNPQLAKQWHKTKNGELKPSQVGLGSFKNVWWQCPKDELHVWQRKVSVRVAGHGCPFCTGRRVCKSNALATIRPELAKQWHKTKNGNLKASQVIAGSHLRVWWQCLNDSEHEWQSIISSRHTLRCPYCTNRIVTSKNSLLALHPLAAQQWHKTLNGKLKPSDVVAGSGKKVWWQCPAADHHVWQAPVGGVVKSRRDNLTTGCPVCARAKRVDGGMTGRKRRR